MLLLNFGNALEQIGDVVKALFPGGLGETGVHVGPLVVLAGGGVLQVVHRVANAPMEELKPHFGVLFLVVGCLLKDGGNLHIAVLLGLGSVVGVLVPRLGFPGKSGHQIGLGLRALQFWHGLFLLQRISVLPPVSGGSSYSIPLVLSKVKGYFANDSHF